MSDLKIEGRLPPVISSPFEKIEDDENTPKVNPFVTQLERKKIYQDTMESGIKGVVSKAGNSFKTLKKWTLGKQEKEKTNEEKRIQIARHRLENLRSSPELKKPSAKALDCVNQSIAEMGANSIADKNALKGTQLTRAIFDAHKDQASIRQKKTEIEQEEISLKGKQNKTMMQKILDQKKIAEEKKKKSKIFGWISTSSLVLGGVLAVAGVVATVFTSGAALPVVFGVAAGVTGIAGGGSQIAKTIFNSQSEEATKKTVKAQEKRRENNSKTTKSLSDIESGDNSISWLWSSIAEVLRNRPKMNR